ncbi:Hypothetical predicted protein [Mytilus galloprovincialis]|uniref:G-protein coupled receptors family 1 profile domain-containing protein n=1 Tax=Mytilus galloprovincialis TaxID=29158 RepID=A0A8B6FZ87_MYTGA|nr:Hypothetical predicted protein [Mytilus galloprovincialis]
MHRTYLINGTDNLYATPKEVGIPMIVITFCSIVISSVVVIVLIKTKKGNFFNWRVIDRFSLYTVICDILFYFSQTAYGTHDWLEKLLNIEISKLECTIYGVLIMEFLLSQVILNTTTAMYAFNLVIRGRKMPLGKWDAYLLCPAFGIPLVLLTTSAFFNQFGRNPVACLLKEERGILSIHFLQIALFFLVSLAIITGLYISMWIYIRRQTTAMNSTFGQQSAVNARRLALNLSLYVLIHVIQFGANAIEATWIAIEEPPVGVRYATIFIGATGGIMNGAVYLTVHKN